MRSPVFAAVTAAVLAYSAVAQAAPHGIFPVRSQQEVLSTLGIPAATAGGKLVYYGGPVIAKAKIYAVMWSDKVDSTTQKQIGAFLSTAVDSTYMDWLKEYDTGVKAVDGRDGTNQHIGRGTYEGLFTIKPSNTASKLDDKDIRAELDHQIDIGALPKPDADTLYMTYFPPNFLITIENMASCSSFCAYHEGFTSQKFGNIYYGVMPDLGGACSFGCGTEDSTFDNLTSVSSHEMIEAITDPFPTPGSNPAYPQAWNTTDGSEIGDLCAQSNTKLASRDITYFVQQEFDNSTNSCAVGPYKQ